MPNNLPSPEEIARVRAKVAGRAESWEDYLPSEDETPTIEDFAERPVKRTNTIPKPSNTPIDDAKRLYRVSDDIYKTLIFFNYIAGIVGSISAIICFIAAANTHETTAGLAGVAVLIGTIAICFINYAAAVLTTHFGKVLSNISISLIGK